MPEENRESPEMEQSAVESTPSRDFAQALRSILDSASVTYPVPEDADIRFSVALVGEMQKDEFVNLVNEAPVVAEIDLDKDLGEKAAILLDMPTASALIAFISSGEPKQEDTLNEDDTAFLREALGPIVDSFSTACEKVAGRPFGSIANIEILDSEGQKRIVEELPESLYRATAAVSMSPEMAGKIVFILPSNLAEMLTETEAVSSKPNVQPDVRAYEHIELKEEDNETVSTAANAREPSMENIDLILDIQLKLTARLGQVEMPIGEILKLVPGSVIDIDRLADEPIELVVNDRPIARGEIVVVQENFGVKITEIISPKDRIESLR
jgi:flagellar motor switch protein FliN/FliY